MTIPIVLTSYCLTAHCLPYMGTLLSLGLLSYSPLFSLVIVFTPIVPRALLFVSLGHLVMVAASVVYKFSLYHRRGLKPDLVFQSKYCCSPNPSCVLLSFPSILPLFGSSQDPLRLSLVIPPFSQDIHLVELHLKAPLIVTKGASPS